MIRALSISLLLLGAANADVPGKDWDRITPVAAGYRQAGLDSVGRLAQQAGSTALVVVVHGRLLYTFGDITQLSYLASARKSVLSMLYGRYVANGTVSLDATLAQLGIDDIGGLTAEERAAHVRDLLEASSGVYHPASNPGDNLADAPPRGSQPPGTYFLYNNWDFNALGAILEQRTGRDVYDLLERDLAIPIGMQDFKRSEQHKDGDTTRSRYPAYHIWLSARDMARLGLLMLDEGRWGRRQIVPADWVRTSTSLQVPAARMHPDAVAAGGIGYGYLWWILEEPPSSPLTGAYVARGAYGQYILVIPRLDMVIVHKRAISETDERAVTWAQFRSMVDGVLSARCEGSC